MHGARGTTADRRPFHGKFCEVLCEAALVHTDQKPSRSRLVLGCVRGTMFSCGFPNYSYGRLKRHAVLIHLISTREAPGMLGRTHRGTLLKTPGG